MIERAIGFGLALNLIFTELFGLPSGGLVVPGYLALFLNQPWRIASTFAAALITWAIVRFGLSRLVILYGRRRFAVTVLCGFLVSLALPAAVDFIAKALPAGLSAPALAAGEAAPISGMAAGTTAGTTAVAANLPDLRVVGHIIPGLIAAEMLSGGVLPVSALALAGAAIVRVLLFLTAGWG